MPSDHLANANSWGLSSLELSRPFWLLKEVARGILLSAVVFFLLTHLLSCLLRPVTLNPPRKTYLTPGEVSLFYLLTLQRSSEVDWNHLCTFRAWHGDLEDGRCSWTQLSFISFPPKCLSSFLLTLKPLLHIWSCFWQTVFFSSTINENLLRLRQWEFLRSLSSERLVLAWQVLNIWRYLMPDEIAQLKYVEFTIPFLRRENWRAPILKANRPKVASRRGYMGVDVCWESSLWGQTNKDLGGGLENKI